MGKTIKKLSQSAIDVTRSAAALATGDVDKAFEYFDKTIAGESLRKLSGAVTGSDKALAEQRRQSDLAEKAARDADILASNQAVEGRQAVETGKVYTGKRGRSLANKNKTTSSSGSLGVSPSTGIQR